MQQYRLHVELCKQQLRRQCTAACCRHYYRHRRRRRRRRYRHRRGCTRLLYYPGGEMHLRSRRTDVQMPPGIHEAIEVRRKRRQPSVPELHKDCYSEHSSHEPEDGEAGVSGSLRTCQKHQREDRRAPQRFAPCFKRSPFVCQDIRATQCWDNIKCACAVFQTRHASCPPSARHEPRAARQQHRRLVDRPRIIL